MLHGWEAPFSQAGTSRQVSEACSDKLSMFVVMETTAGWRRGCAFALGTKLPR